MTTEVALLQYVNPNDLAEHPEAHRIPEMTADEWAGFSEDVRTKKMITSPVYALRNGIVFDGRHRLRAAMEYGIKLIPVLFYDITEDEALERMRQEAVERRQLTLGQRVMINLEFSELVERLRAEARERQLSAGKHGVEGGRGNVKETLSADLHQGFDEEQPQPVGKVAEQIASLSGTSARNVYKAQAVIREAPDLAEKIKAGEITINKAESELKKRKAAEKPVETDKPATDSKLERIKQRKKPEPIDVREGESSISPNNRLGMFVTEGLTPFIDDLLASYHTAKMADEEARKPYIQELEIVFEASFRILAELKGDALIKKMEEIQNDEE